MAMLECIVMINERKSACVRVWACRGIESEPAPRGPGKDIYNLMGMMRFSLLLEFQSSHIRNLLFYSGTHSSLSILVVSVWTPCVLVWMILWTTNWPYAKEGEREDIQ